MEKKIGIACDHAAFDLKEFLVGYLGSKGYEVVDFGTHSEESCDYPDFAHALGQAIDNGELVRGVALCGSGEGISMTLNKHQSVRAALCWIPEIAKLSRQHNNSNVLCMPARFITNDEALEMLNIWLETEFEGGRHQRRLDKMPISK